MHQNLNKNLKNINKLQDNTTNRKYMYIQELYIYFSELLNKSQQKKEPPQKVQKVLSKHSGKDFQKQ